MDFEILKITYYMILQNYARVTNTTEIPPCLCWIVKSWTFYFHILSSVDLNWEFLSLFGDRFPEIYISCIEFRWLHFVEDARNWE